jgi:flagellar hook protein FlgE
MSAYSTALSGLLANNTALDVVGNNLANMNTDGFKTDSVQFQDAIVQANQSLQVGEGVESTITETNFSQGNLQTTNQPLDAAIQGGGFFVIQDPSSGAIQYTRDGSFSLNSSGQLVTSSGDLVQGWMASNGTVTPSGATTAITVPALNSQTPSATANMTLSANLDATTASGGSFSTTVGVVDSLGNLQTVTVDFTEAGANTWNYTATIPGQDVKGGTAGTPTTIGTGTLTFDTNGNLKSPASGTPAVLKTTGGLADGAADLNINWNLYDASGNATITQYAQASAASGSTQDGVQPGTVTGVSLENGGDLVATYSNGNVVTIAQVALAAVTNPESLVAVANNNFTVGSDTVTPSIGAADTSQRGSIVAGSLETSNVDMATEFTNLILYQRGYEANSKVLTTVEQMEQALLAMNP